MDGASVERLQVGFSPAKLVATRVGFVHVRLEALSLQRLASE